MSSYAAPKSKKGCITCRIRKVKCDERKPACTRCTTTGRKCDGYRSAFRFFTRSEPESTLSQTSSTAVQLRHHDMAPLIPRIALGTFLAPEQVQYLARHFTIEPVPSMGANYETGVSYELEARATLCATSEPAVYHALASLTVLRGVFDQYGGSFPHKIPAVSPAVQHGLQEYENAIKSLVVRLSNRNALSIHYSLLCCQMFMSIELAMDDFTSCTQHFIRGIRIMHQGRSRPYLGSNGNVMAAQLVGMPALDAFAIKLFLTPCPDGLTEDFLIPDDEAQNRVIAPLSTERAAILHANMHLADLGRSTLNLLDNVSRLSPESQAETVSTLASNRINILHGLQAWKDDFVAIAQLEISQDTSWARLGTTFSIFFNTVLRSIVTLAFRSLEVEGESVELVFNEMLEVAYRLGQLKKEVNGVSERQLEGIDEQAFRYDLFL